MLTVEKIGGTSMAHFDLVLKNIILNPALKNNDRIFVVSAYSGVTNWLLEHKKTGEPGIYTKFLGSNGYMEALDKLLINLLFPLYIR